MKRLYLIEYSDGSTDTMTNRKDLIEWLEIISGRGVQDIRKVRELGISISVLEEFRQYIR